MSLTPYMVRMMSPFMAAIPASSFQYSAWLNTKATPTDNATKKSDSNSSKADPTPSSWTGDTKTSGDSPSSGYTPRGSSMKSSDDTTSQKTDPTPHFWTSDTNTGDSTSMKSSDDTNSRKTDPNATTWTGDATSGSDTSRNKGAAENSGDPTVPSPRGAASSQSNASYSRTGGKDSSSQSGETQSRTGSSDTKSRSGDKTASSGDDISVTTQSGDDRDENSGSITSRLKDEASRGLDTLKRKTSSSTSWNPFSDNDSDFTEFFRNPFGMFNNTNSGTHQQHAMRNFPKVDIIEEGESLKIFADLPGIEKQDIKVHMDASNNLRISGKRECEIEEEDDDRHYRRYERSCGRFSRNIRMPEKVDKQSIDASFHNGVLTIQLKKTAEEDQRGSNIEIK